MNGTTRIDIPLLAAGDSTKIIVNNEREQGSLPISQEIYESVIETEIKSVYVVGQGGYQDLSGKRYPLEKWCFRWTKKFKFVNDPVVIPFKEAMDREIANAGREAQERRKREKEKDKAN